MCAYRGHVYENGEGGRRPLPHVLVTDGRHVVRTGTDGSYALPGYEKTRFITITVPSGYRAKTHYIPVSGQREAYDFDVAACGCTRGHSFIHIADTEVGKQGVGAWKEDILQAAGELQAAFIVHTGDICYEDGLRAHIRGLNSDTAGLPVHYAIGNHDFIDGPYGEWLFESLYGPTWYSFEAGNIHYIVTPIERGLDYPSGYTREDLYLWLKNDLEQKPGHMRVMVFNHYILDNEQSYRVTAEGYPPLDLREYGLIAWVYGHCHIHYVREKGGVLSIGTGTPDKGGCDHSPMAFRIVRVSEQDQITTRLHYCRVPAHMAIAYPQDGQSVCRRAGAELSLSVNAYSGGGPVSRVSGRLTGPGLDRTLVFRPSGDWNWKAETPFHALGSGEYTLAADAVFSDGTVTAASSRFTVTEGERREPMRVRWCRNTGASILFSAPVLTEDRVVVGASDDNGTGRAGVWAFEKATGAFLWHYPTRNSVKNRVIRYRDRIVAQDAEGGLYALSLDTGEPVWQTTLPYRYFSYLAEGMTEADGILYAGGGEALGAYRLDTGELLWRNQAWSYHSFSPSRWTVEGGVLIAGTEWGGLYGMDCRTGDLLWQHKENSLRFRSTEGWCRDGELYIAARSDIFVLDIRTGEILRQREYPAYSFEVSSAPAAAGDKLIFATANAGVVAVDRRTLEPLWHFDTGPALCGSAPYTAPPAETVECSPAAAGGRVFFGASDGRVYALDAETGGLLSALDFGVPVFAVSAVRDGQLAAADMGGSIYFIDI